MSGHKVAPTGGMRPADEQLALSGAGINPAGSAARGPHLSDAEQMKRRITDQLDAQETGSVKHSQPATLQHASTDTTELGADGFPVKGRHQRRQQRLAQPKYDDGAAHHPMDFHDLRSRFQATTHAGVKTKHMRALTVLGRIGWCAKGIVYGLIGGLCCRGAVSEGLQDTSPQGAFILLGKGATGIYILIVMAVALATYIAWRFWEGVTGQGQHECYSNFKNFFTFRLSPFVSGLVYTAYLVYILTLIPKAFRYKNNEVENTRGSDFTASWRKTNIGKTGLFLVGVAFLIAFVVMVQGALTKKFHRELRLKELRCWSKWLVLVSGHLGALGRAALFMGVAILMFRAMGDKGNANKKENTVSKALNQLVTSNGGRAVLFIIGFGLILYTLFAVLNAYPAKIFPTPLPSEGEMEHMMRGRHEKKQATAGRKMTAKERLADYRDEVVNIVYTPSYVAAHSVPSHHSSESHSRAGAAPPQQRMAPMPEHPPMPPKSAAAPPNAV